MKYQIYRGSCLGAENLMQEACDGGVAASRLYLFRDDGAVSEISRGVYRKAEAPETAHLDLLAVVHRAPLAVVCLISALALHELTDEVPAVVQIAVPRGTHRPRITYPPTEVSEFDLRTFNLGIQERAVAPGERVRIYGPARSVVDVMRLRHRVGDLVAISGGMSLSPDVRGQ